MCINIIYEADHIVPGVVYGLDDDRNVLKRMVAVDQKLLLKELRVRGASFENTIYEVVIKSETGSVSYIATPRQTQLCAGEQTAVYRLLAS